MNEILMRKKLMVLDLKKLQKKADTKFQLMRRFEEANKDGVVRCISCGLYGSYKTFDGGHFIPRHHLGARYNPLNVWPQCKKCNKWLSGNHAKYRENLIKKIGKEKVEELESNKDELGGISYRNLCIDIFISSKDAIKNLEKTEIVTMRVWNK